MLVPRVFLIHSSSFLFQSCFVSGLCGPSSCPFFICHCFHLHCLCFLWVHLNLIRLLLTFQFVLFFHFSNLKTFLFGFSPFFNPQDFKIRFNSILQTSIVSPCLYWLPFPTNSSSFSFQLLLVLSLPAQVPPPFHLPMQATGVQAFPSNFLQATGFQAS